MSSRKNILIGLAALMVAAAATFLVSTSLSKAQITGDEVGSPDVPAAEALPWDGTADVSVQNSETMCLYVYTGTHTMRYRITNPGGISGFREYHLVNFEQRLLQSSSTSIDIEVRSTFHVDTKGPYPVNPSALPSEIRSSYLQPGPGIQSDAPEILAKADELVAESTRQAEAVEAILTWVRANIQYDSSAPANDALSVFINRRAVCAGFSNLSVALLRAAGIPSRYRRGCSTPYGYITGDGGGWHAWVEVYYPDVGWVASEPQNFVNAMRPYAIPMGFDQCGSSDTEIAELSRQDDGAVVYVRQTPYSGEIRSSIATGSVPSWDRHPLMVVPSSPGVMLSIADPVGRLALQIDNVSCGESGWLLKTDAPWLAPPEVSDTVAGTASLTVDASGMYTGHYTAPMTVYSGSSLWWSDTPSKSVTANLWLVDEIHEVHLPIVAKGD